MGIIADDDGFDTAFFTGAAGVTGSSASLSGSNTTSDILGGRTFADDSGRAVVDVGVFIVDCDAEEPPVGFGVGFFSEGSGASRSGDSSISSILSDGPLVDNPMASPDLNMCAFLGISPKYNATASRTSMSQLPSIDRMTACFG